MQRLFKRTVLMISGFAILVAGAGCAAMHKGPSGDHEGFLQGFYQNLTPGPKGGLKARWIKPGVDFSKYNRVMLDSVVFYFAQDAKYKGIDAERMKELSDAFNLEAVKALKDSYPIVAEPAADVLRLRVAITDLKPSKPGLSTVTTVIPVGMGVSLVKKGVTGEWSGAGDTSMELMALDSLTNTVVAVAEDSYGAGFTERFTRWGSADDAFKFWAGRLKYAMDKGHEQK